MGSLQGRIPPHAQTRRQLGEAPADLLGCSQGGRAGSATRGVRPGLLLQAPTKFPPSFVDGTRSVRKKVCRFKAAR